MTATLPAANWGARHSTLFWSRRVARDLEPPKTHHNDEEGGSRPPAIVTVTAVPPLTGPDDGSNETT